MKKSIIAATLLATSSVATAGPWTVISDWDYINEAGFFAAQTGYADDGSFSDPYGIDAFVPAVNVPGVTTTVDGNYVPTDSTGVPDLALVDAAAGATGTFIAANHYVDANGYNWFLNTDGVIPVWFNYGTTTSSEAGTTGTSNNGFTSILDANAAFDVFDSACWGLSGQPLPSCVKFVDENGDDSSRIEGLATTGMYGNQIFNEGTSVTHENNPAGAPSLTSIVLADGLQLASSELAGGAILAPELYIPINFVETFANAQALWPEAPDDMFILDFSVLDGTSDVSVDFGADFVDFTIGLTLENSDFASNGEDYHKEYEITTRLSGLDFFSSSENEEVVGILTKEGENNTLKASFAISAVNVSEPSALAVFGLGLLGLAGFARRRKA